MCANTLLEVKSKFGAEFRRFSIDPSVLTKFDDLHAMLERLHKLDSIPFVVQYVTSENSFLPISNDKNFALALSNERHVLRIVLQRKGESYGEIYGYTSSKPTRLEKSVTHALLSFGNPDKLKPARATISLQDDFQLVCSVLDANILPREMRRVRLIRTPNKQFGLYIRDGISTRLTEGGYEAVPAFFISRLDKDGIAYSTGLLAENDELIEVNGIEVFDKTMDQVTDMMVANSSNLIITVRPSDQARLRYQPSAAAPRAALSPPSRNNPFNAYQSDQPRYTPSTARGPPAQQPTGDGYGTDDEENEEDMTTGLITL